MADKGEYNPAVERSFVDMRKGMVQLPGNFCEIFILNTI
jgi:hypothetical protein